MKEAKALLKRLRPQFRFHERKVKFTLIDIGPGQQSFLSLVRDCPGVAPNGDANISIHSTTGPRAIALLTILKNLADVEDPRELPNWDAKLELEKKNA